MLASETEQEGSKRVRKPCSRCINAKVGCDHKRPCSRCVKRGEPEKCFDIVRKQRTSKKNTPNTNNSTSGEFDKFLLSEPPLLFEELKSNLDLEVFLDTLLTPADVLQTLQDSHQLTGIPISPTDTGGPIIQEIYDSNNNNNNQDYTESDQIRTNLISNIFPQENTNITSTQKDIHIINTNTNLCITNPNTNTNIHISNANTNSVITVSRPNADLNSIPRSISKPIPRAIFSNTELVALDCNMAFAEMLGYPNPASVIGKTLKDFVPAFSYQYAARSCMYFKENKIQHYERLGIFARKNNSQTWATLCVDMMELSYTLAVPEVHDNVPNCFRWTLKHSVIDGETKKIILPTPHAAFCPRSHCQCKLLINV
eukprot:Phypoly_transcript_08326.p1 GENE.Phypoly_transcript_08326~~Phypoly_transcript_08326.p1  ORF type:complete len:370 (+),score=32.73 Phypoly_transcript_08326:361-1470(+)